MCKEKKPGNAALEKNEVVRQMGKQDGKWQTWITVDGKPVPGSVLVHRDRLAARRWVTDDRKH